MKHYIPLMGVSLPLDEDSLYRVYKNFYGQEVAYAGFAEDVGYGNEGWRELEDAANMFADSADELSAYDDEQDPDYVLLSKLIEEVEIGSDEEFPEYHPWYDEKGNPVDY